MFLENRWLGTGFSPTGIAKMEDNFRLFSVIFAVGSNGKYPKQRVHATGSSLPRSSPPRRRTAVLHTSLPMESEEALCYHIFSKVLKISRI